MSYFLLFSEKIYQNRPTQEEVLILAAIADNIIHIVLIIVFQSILPLFIGHYISEKYPVIVVFAFNVSWRASVVELSSQRTNSNPSAGRAVTVTLVPAGYS